MKKPIAVAAAVAVLAVTGTAIAAPGGGILGGGQDERQAEFASDLAKQLDGVNANQVEQGLEQVQADRETEKLNERAEGLASQLDSVSVEQAKAAIESVHATLEAGAENGERPERSEVEALLAEELGVSVEELEQAREAEHEAKLDQAVEDGRITEEQADEIRQGIEDGSIGGPGRGPGHGPGPGGPGGYGPGPGGPGADDASGVSGA